MRQYYVFSILGTDRTGLVDQVSEAIRRASGNLEDSRMAVLGEEFAMMILCSVDSAQSEKLHEELRTTTQSLDLLFQAKLTSARRLGQKMVPLLVEVKGMDHEGIVNDVVHHLVEQGISVDSLDSQVVNAPYSGVALFEMRMRVQAPASVSLASIRRHLQTVGDKLNVDVEIHSGAV